MILKNGSSFEDDLSLGAEGQYSTHVPRWDLALKGLPAVQGLFIFLHNGFFCFFVFLLVFNTYLLLLFVRIVGGSNCHKGKSTLYTFRADTLLHIPAVLVVQILHIGTKSLCGFLPSTREGIGPSCSPLFCPDQVDL